MPTDPPEFLGRFGVRRALEAWDPVLRRAVAVKILPEHRRRFVAEAQLTRPDIVPVCERGAAPTGEVWFATNGRRRPDGPPGGCSAPSSRWPRRWSTPMSGGCCTAT